MRRLAALALALAAAAAPRGARAALLQFYDDAACANGTTPPVGPFFATQCDSLTGQGAALTACNAAASPPSATVAIFGDAFCTGAPANSFAVTSTGCTAVTSAVFGAGGGYARLAAPPAGTLCAPTSQWFRLQVTAPNPLAPTDGENCVGPAETVTIDGGDCAANGLFGFSVFTKVAAAGQPTQPHALCAWQAEAACRANPCSAGASGGASEQFHLGFAALGVCLAYQLPVPVPLPIPLPKAGLLLDKAPPYPPVVSPSPSGQPLPSFSPSPGGAPSRTPGGTPAASASPTNVAGANTANGGGGGGGAGGAGGGGNNALAGVVAAAVLVAIGMFVWVQRKKLMRLSSPLHSGPVGEVHVAANPLGAGAPPGAGTADAQRDFELFILQRAQMQQQQAQLQQQQAQMQMQMQQQAQPHAQQAQPHAQSHAQQHQQAQGTSSDSIAAVNAYMSPPTMVRTSHI